MRRRYDFDALISFNAVALHGGLGAAARAVQRPKATLSRHLAQLEQELGVRLVERGDRRLRLTDEGRRLHERTHGLILEIDDVTESVAGAGERPRGILRVSAPMVLAHVALLPIALRFAAVFPEVELHLVAEDRKVDPIEDGYDLVLRIDPAADERLVGRRIATDSRVLVAAPGFDMPLDGREPVRAVTMVSVLPTPNWRVRLEDGTTRLLTPEPRLRLSSLLMVRGAVIAGFGAAVLPGLLVAEDLADGRLIRWGSSDVPPVEIWALHPSRRLVSTKVRSFLSVLEDGLTG